MLALHLIRALFTNVARLLIISITNLFNNKGKNPYSQNSSIHFKTFNTYSTITWNEYLNRDWQTRMKPQAVEMDSC